MGHKYALSKATVMRTKILSVTPLNPLGVTAPLMNKGSQENCVNAIPCRRYNPSVSFADSSPYTGEPRSALQTLGANFARGGAEAAAAADRRNYLGEHRGAEKRAP